MRLSRPFRFLPLAAGASLLLALSALLTTASPASTRVSVDSAGDQANSGSGFSSISAEGPRKDSLP